jgi:hypothetical protein
MKVFVYSILGILRHSCARSLSDSRAVVIGTIVAIAIVAIVTYKDYLM